MKKILVVDDEVQIISILKSFFTKKGYQVITASRGGQAIETVKSDPKIDLLIIDIKMPGKTGIDVLEEVKQLKVKFPVIVLTGSINAEKYEGKLAKIGYSKFDIALKPINLNVLLSKVQKKLGREDKED